ncbi:MAG: hypothetical protein QOH26_787, partial [Actinomycetota bacterium]|nr:hypothetical protein [Actinomycetota bacterium]
MRKRLIAVVAAIALVGIAGGA